MVIDHWKETTKVTYFTVCNDGLIVCNDPP